MQFIEAQKIDLSKQIPNGYREFVYDVTIQLANGLKEAHSHGLVHGNFDISKVVLEFSGKQMCMECKITDFEPQLSM